MTQIVDGLPDRDQADVTVILDRRTSDSALPAASTIGPYEITGLLGRGGMGIVYSAMHRKTHQTVALKTALVRDASHLACMRREIHALSRLQHPGVVRIIEEGVDGGVPWYAMELLDPDRSLRTLLDNSALVSQPPDPGDGEVQVGRKPRVRGDLPQVLSVMYRLCRVLGYIHSHGIVHRDLKPANVLLGDADRPVLVDFGLMVRVRGDSSREVLEVAGQSLGTFTYISPEQADGQLVDARTDLYSFGVILYEAVTGRPPFDASSFARLTHQLFFEPPIAPSEWVDGLPPVLDHLVLRLMQKKPGDRYGYADDVAAMLVEAGAEPQPEADDEGPSYLYRPELEGRGAIMETLGKRLESVLQGNGMFVAVGGVSGIGKTSVATAFSRKATRKRMMVITGECVPVTTDGEIGGEPLHPLRPLLHAIADHCLELGPAELERVIGPRLAVLKDYLPGLTELALARGDEGLHLGASVRHRRLFPDLAEVLAAFTHNQPVLLILDDLQWADEVTLRFLASLRPEFFIDTKLMILGLYRSDEVGPELSDLLAAPHLAKISLERLDDGSVAAIVKSMLAENEPSPTFVDFVARQSQGSPFFVAEYLRAAVNERLLHREGGRWRLRQGDDDAAWAKLGLPGSVLDLVGHRLAALSPTTRHIAEVAAVLGRELDEPLLLAAAGIADQEAMEAISDLVARQILEQQAGSLRFVHDKQREVLYGKLDAERRRELHRRAAMTIEAHGQMPGAPQPNLAELANHWEVAGEIDKAIDCYEKAGQQALRSGAGREASDYLQRVLALAGNAAAAAPQRARRARWHGLLSDARFSLSDFTGFHEHAREVLALAGMPLPHTPFALKWAILRQVAEQAAHLVLPRALYRSRRSKWPLLSQASNTAERIAEHAFYAKDSLMMACAGFMAVNLAERMGDQQNVARGYSNVAYVVGFSGLTRLAMRYFRTGGRIARQAGDLDGQMRIGYSVSFFHCGLAEWDEAYHTAKEAFDLAQRLGDPQESEMAEMMLGYCEFYTGDVEKSVRTYNSIRDSARKRANLQHEAWGHTGTAKSLVFLGRLDEAQASLDAARRLNELQPDHLSELVAIGVQTEIHFQRGDLDRATEAADLAYALVSEAPMVLFELFRTYAASAEVYVALWQRARENNDTQEMDRRRKAVFAICAKLRRMALVFPAVWPTAYRLAGIARCLDGDSRRGRRLLEKAVATASRLGLPLDEAAAKHVLTANRITQPFRSS